MSFALVRVALKNEGQHDDREAAKTQPRSAKFRENAQFVHPPPGPAPGQRRAPRLRCASRCAGRSALTACPSQPCLARTSFSRDRPLDLSRRRKAISVAVRPGPVARGLTTAKSTRAARSAVRGGGVWDNPYPRPGLQDLRGEIGELRRTARRTASQISVG